MKNFSDAVYNFLRSVKLALVLIILIALLAGLGGLIPQGEAKAFYTQKFPGLPSRLILALGLDAVFKGLPFLILSALFTVNLTVCSFHRFFNELAKPRKNRRHGPDILHLGLLVFIFGGVLSARTRTENFFYLSKGQSLLFVEGSRITLVDLREEQYPDGRPKSWESSLNIGAEAEQGYVDEFDALAAVPAASSSLPATHRVKVNSPLRYKGYTIYQQSWKTTARARLTDPMGMSVSMEQGSRFRTGAGTAGGAFGGAFGGAAIVFMALEQQQPSEGAEHKHRAVFLLETAEGSKVVRIAPGETIGPFRLEKFEQEAVSGLKIVKDKGYGLVAGGLFLVVLGSFLTYIRKLKGLFA